jgi:excisionase family DNA binding protein
MMESKGTYSTGDVARLLSMHRDTVQKWCKAGKIRAFRVAGGKYRITAEALRELMGLTVNTPPVAPSMAASAGRKGGK